MEETTYVGEERRRSHLDLNNRLVVVETKLETLDDIKKSLDTLNTELTKYKGMVGGILWIGSALMALIALFKDEVLKFFGR